MNITNIINKVLADKYKKPLADMNVRLLDKKPFKMAKEVKYINGNFRWTTIHNKQINIKWMGNGPYLSIDGLLKEHAGLIYLKDPKKFKLENKEDMKEIKGVQTIYSLPDIHNYLFIWWK